MGRLQKKLSLALISLAAFGFTGWSTDSAAASYFDVRCSFASTAPALDICTAEFRLCNQTEAPGCKDHGTVSCGADAGTETFNGEFQRSQTGNVIHLTGLPTGNEAVPRVDLGPAKNPPKPGRPTESDSALDYNGRQASGTCTVRMVR